MMDCKQALTESKGDMEQAIISLRKRGAAVAQKKATRVTSEGSVASYIHAGGKIGVLVEVNCESDFVARTDEFKDLLKDIAMHIAAADPKFVRREDVTPDAYEREKEIYRAQAPAATAGEPPTEAASEATGVETSGEDISMEDVLGRGTRKQPLPAKDTVDAEEIEHQTF